MKNVTAVAAAAVLAAGTVLAADGAAQGNVPGEWNLAAREKFAAQRFGVFIHWGLYANYAQGEWYLQSARLDEPAYARMMYGFCPSKFEAREWVRVVKGAGAKYITITSRHHDGFSLWPTKADDGYNISLTPFGRDILGELAQACREAGLQLNFYYSLMDWHRKDYPAGNVARAVLGDQKGDYGSYKRFMLAQIGELIDSYHPGCIWFDGEWEQPSFDWDFDTIYDFIHARRTLVANNNHRPIRAKEDIQLFERDLPGEGAMFSKDQPLTRDRPVEQCDVIQYGVWGYKIGQKNFRPPEEVVAMVARAAAKDANLLMNIGPDGSGQFPAKAVETMAKTGEWFARYGETIYGTRGCGIASGGDVVATRRDGTLYLHFLKPGIDEIVFRPDGKIAEAKCLVKGGAASVAAAGPAGGGAVSVKVTRPEGFGYDLPVRLTFE